MSLSGTRLEAQQRRRASAPPCSVDACAGRSVAKGLCNKHYNATRKSMCSEPGCTRPAHGHGLCVNHYWKGRRKKIIPFKPCRVDRCEKAAEQHGMCFMHFFRVDKFGDTHARLRVANGEATTADRRAQQTARQRRYRATPHGKMRQSFNTAKRRILSGKTDTHISKHEFLALWNSPLCGICVAPVSDGDKTIDHKTPLARGGRNDISNMQIAHMVCNQRKGARMELRYG